MDQQFIAGIIRYASNLEVVKARGIPNTRSRCKNALPPCESTCIFVRFGFFSIQELSKLRPSSLHSITLCRMVRRISRPFSFSAPSSSVCSSNANTPLFRLRTHTLAVYTCIHISSQLCYNARRLRRTLPSVRSTINVSAHSLSPCGAGLGLSRVKSNLIMMSCDGCKQDHPRLLVPA